MEHPSDGRAPARGGNDVALKAEEEDDPWETDTDDELLEESRVEESRAPTRDGGAALPAISPSAPPKVNARMPFTSILHLGTP